MADNMKWGIIGCGGIAKETPAVRGFFGANPFISISNGTLYETRVSQTDPLSDNVDHYPGLAGQHVLPLDQTRQPPHLSTP